MAKLLSPQLQAFLAIVKHKTVYAAANNIFLTQTAVTRRIKALEEHLATSLFVRTRQGMKLTAEGQALLRYCHQAEALEGKALPYVTGTGIEKQVTVSLTGPATIIYSRIVPQCLAVMKQFPKLSLHYHVDDNESRVETLRRGDSQLAIIPNNLLSEEMEYKHLVAEHYILVATEKWGSRSLEDIVRNEMIIDFNAEDEITFNYLKQYNLLGLARSERHFVNHTSTLALMISQGLGYSVLPKEFVKPYLKDKQLITIHEENIYLYHMSLAWYPRHEQPKYFSAIIDACI